MRLACCPTDARQLLNYRAELLRLDGPLWGDYRPAHRMGADARELARRASPPRTPGCRDAVADP